MHEISFYPVGNGDTAQIVLSGGRRVLFDFCHKDKGEEDDTPEIDLKARLKEELGTRDYFDVVAFTHADKDHIQGSTDFFYLEHAKKYQSEGRIKISELWVPAAMLLEEATRDKEKPEFVVLRQEARHRLLQGKGIRVFSKPQALKAWLEPALKDRGENSSSRDHLFVDAGTLVKGFSLANDGVEFFCHSPFIEHCDGDGDIVRNSASLVFNVRFEVDGAQYDFLQVGDTEAKDLEEIVRITKFHGRANRLAWNLFNIPHHCSYLALGDDKGAKKTEPKALVKELLLSGKVGAYVVSSSKPVPNDKDAYLEIQPPHIQARNTYEEYLGKVVGRRFLVTMEEPNERRPEPLVFQVTRGGITWNRPATGSASVVSSAPPRAG